MKKVRILKSMVTASSFQEACDDLAQHVAEKKGMHLCPANVYSVSYALFDKHYQSVINQAEQVSADGMPLVWAMKLMMNKAERVHNDDLFFRCVDKHRDWKHFFVGGREGQPEAVVAELEKRYPGVQVAGLHATPVRPMPEAQSEKIVEMIKATDPDVVWVGMGTPAQDLWIRKVMDEVDRPMVGVGSVFDLIVGNTKKAPDWMMRSGLQWFFRLCQEPKRLFKRYLIYNTIYLTLFGVQYFLWLIGFRKQVR